MFTKLRLAGIFAAAVLAWAIPISAAHAQQPDGTLAEPGQIFLRAATQLEAQTAAHDEIWQLGESDWAVDLERGIITFTNPQGWIITAPVQVVGTYSLSDGTFLWGWDHPSVPEPASQAARQVRAFGEQYSTDLLTTRLVEATEGEAWVWTALANHLWQGQGAYRAQTGSALVFMTFGRITISKP